MRRKLKLALILFFLGFSGILTTISIEFPLPQKVLELLGQSYSNWQIKGLLLINPTILLIVGITLGTFFYNKVNLSLPLLENWLHGKKLPSLYPLLIIALGGGVFCGLIITVSFLIFQPILPVNFLDFSKSYNISPWVRFLYGGFTEEIIMRFGIMTFIIWLCYRIFKTLSNSIYWIGIGLSAFLFAVGHLPAMYLFFDQPGPITIIYILLTNFMAGVVYGWLYWRKGLETAILAHMITHVVLIFAQI